MAKRAADSDLAPTPKKARLDGKGTRTRENGTVETGVFVDDQLVKGTKTHADVVDARFADWIRGMVETGVFVDQLVKGTRTYKNGTVEEGTFNGNLVEGKKTHKNGSVEKGTFAMADGYSFLVKGKCDDYEDGTFDDFLLKGTKCKFGIDSFLKMSQHVTVVDVDSANDEGIRPALYKGVWDETEKFTGVKFYFELKGQYYEKDELRGTPFEMPLDLSVDDTLEGARPHRVRETFEVVGQ